MNNGKKTAVIIILGVFVPIAVGIALIFTGGSMFDFNIIIAGIVVTACGPTLTGLIACVVYTVRNWQSIKEDAELEKNKYAQQKIAKKQQPEAVKNDKTVDRIMDKEDELTEYLELNYKIDLLRQYKVEAEPIWERYTGDFWDENLQQLDELIDKYNELIK